MPSPVVDPVPQSVPQIPRVVVVGAGFAGLACARRLARESNLVEVLLIDKHPYQLFSPLLYQVATGGLPEDDICYPVRAAIPGVRFRRGDVVHINQDARTVRMADGGVERFDELVMAVGSTGTDFGVPGVCEHALQMKTVDQARQIRRRLMLTYEDAQEGRVAVEELQVVVVGGGPTGVELAGAIAELQKGMHREYPEIAEYASVALVEAGPHVLPMFTTRSQQRAREDLQALGVRVVTGAPVDRVHPSAVHLHDGEVLPAGTTIWAAGVAGYEQWSMLGETDRLHRVQVDECLRVSDRVWVVGDGAHFTPPGSPTPLPMVAPVALQMGRYVAEQILARQRGQALCPFTYRDKGQMATVGRRRAVVETPGGRSLSGTVAWLAWLVLHVFYLAGGRNRVSVVADWMWNYVMWGRSPRRAVLE